MKNVQIALILSILRHSRDSGNPVIRLPHIKRIVWITIFVWGVLFSFLRAEEAIISVTPQALWSRPQQEHRFTVKGGLPPIRWQTRAGDVKALEERVFLYRAPKRYMRDQLRFFDRAAQEAQVTIDILRPLSVSPSIRNVPVNGRAEFSVHGGSSKWEVSDDGGLQVAKLEKTKLEINAGNSTGRKNLRIHDQVTEEQFDIVINVYTVLEVREQQEEE
ncbi:MAG: hypothetical protein GY862_29840 [Gammaproteobacteria bacterium]|nr:hypothetical protein [Gammaproteobacteria bacterium]